MKELFRDSLLEEHINFEKERIHVLTALFGATCQKENKILIEMSKSIELMKAATLIIDDFLDKADKRNGIPSIFYEKGPEEAVLIGEILKSCSLQDFMVNIERLDLSTKRKFECIKLFEQVYKTVCIGQLEDMILEKKNLEKDFVTVEDFFSMIRKTSAVFIQFPVILGSFIGNFSEKEKENLKEFGIKIGLAYQLRDDVLDVLGDQDYIGKFVGGDIREKKKRILLLLALKNCSDEERKKLIRIYSPEHLITDEDVCEVIKIFNKTKAISKCISLVEKYCQEAILHLEVIKNKEVRQQLKDIAWLLTRFEDLPKQ